MVAGLAFVATAVATLFAQATAVRWSRSRAPHQGAWTVALALFALASAAMATGASTGWDVGTFRAFYLLGAIVNVPWLALGTAYLLGGRRVGDPARTAVLLFTGLATGVMLAAPVHGEIAPDRLPVGKDHLDPLARILAGVGSGAGAIVVFGGAAWSAARLVRRRRPGTGRLAAGNALIALGTLVLSSGGLAQGVLGHDESFALSLALGISVIYAGFAVASVPRPAASVAGSDPRPPRAAPAGADVDAAPGSPGEPAPSSRRSSLPIGDRGSSSTSSTRVGSL
jgi:hypothetical protein